jgi:HupE / UreJ protein
MTTLNRTALSNATRCALLLLVAPALVPMLAAAHNVSGTDQSFIESVNGMHLAAFAYLGAKHMVTGYDHLLYLFGVVFFLYRLRDVAAYVTLFAIGHSATLLAGVLGGLWVNPFIVDAIIGFSVVYKAFENVGGFKTVFGFQPNPKLAVLFFGLCHGFGLATKLQDLKLSSDGLVPNMLAFNVGVELGQLAALGIILLVINAWRATASFERQAFAANVVLMTAGFVLAGYQLAGLQFSS